ncbi:MAG TPA: AraC family transcriptional regulator [Puia sp.]|jgi:AraC-like DNA-binding protein|nr:AraC family transcriptional regulator [Puia sp.]
MQPLNLKYAPILTSCVEEGFYKTEAVWEYHSLMRIISGEMKIVLAENTHEFNAGDTFLVPRNRLSSVIKRSKDGIPFNCILITFRPEQLKDYYSKQKFNSKLPSWQKVKHYTKDPLLDSLFASLMPYFDLQNSLTDDLIKIKIEEAITILRTIDKSIDGLFSDFTEPGKIDLADFMEKAFMFNLTLGNFASLTGRSIATFNRDFRKAFNTPPQRWLVKKRLELAHYEIFEKGRKPGNVYIEVGFENFSHFSYVFKKHFGYSPTRSPVSESGAARPSNGLGNQ